MTTTFKGTLFTPIRFTIDNLPPKTYYLEFTKSQIIFPEKFKDIKYDKSEIKDRAYYKLSIYDNIDMRYRYEITIGNSQPIRLWVNKKEEKKLKKIHGLSWYAGLPIKWDLIKIFIAFALSAIVSISLFLLNRQTIHIKSEQQQSTIDSLSSKIFQIEKNLEASRRLKYDTANIRNNSNLIDASK